jgi:hypothetical protein
VGVFALSISFNSCKGKSKEPSDADIKAAIETQLKADPMAATTMVSFEKGVATITGECKDDSCKAHCAEIVKGVKGVKEVVNNCTFAEIRDPTEDLNPDDAYLFRHLAMATMDFPDLKWDINNDGKIVLTGKITKAKWVILKQTLDELKSNGYDLTGLTIK